MSARWEVDIAGGDTSAPLNLAKRLAVLRPHLVPGQTRVLDGGCGAGEYVAELVRRFGVDARGVEYQREKVEQAQRSGPCPDRVEQGDLQALRFPDADFDLVLLNEVLEHVPDERRALAEVRRVLRPHGTLVVFSPNRLYPFETHGVFLRGTRRQVSPWVPFVPYLPLGVGRRFFDYWARNYFPGELTDLVRRAGFTVTEQTWVWQTFENISGAQPALVRLARPQLRHLAQLCERAPLIRRLGVSQVVVARRA